MRIVVVGPVRCAACDNVKRTFRELKIPYKSRMADNNYRKERQEECAKYPNFPHVYDLDRKENKGFWFSGGIPKNTISKVLNRKQPKNIKRR